MITKNTVAAFLLQGGKRSLRQLNDPATAEYWLGDKGGDPTCAVTRRRFPAGANPARRPLQPEATGAGMEVTKCLKPPDSGHEIGDRASVQAAT